MTLPPRKSRKCKNEVQAASLVGVCYCRDERSFCRCGVRHFCGVANCKVKHYKGEFDDALEIGGVCLHRRATLSGPNSHLSNRVMPFARPFVAVGVKLRCWMLDVEKQPKADCRGKSLFGALMLGNQNERGITFVHQSPSLAICIPALCQPRQRH